MIDLNEVHLALRAVAESVIVAQTADDAVIGATATGFFREEGSWLEDGFRKGMEVVADGHWEHSENQASKIIVDVDDYDLTILDGLTEEDAASGRAIVAAYPELRGYRGVTIDPSIGRPWAQERFIPETSFLVTSGPRRSPGTANRGLVEHRGRLIITLFALASNNQGTDAGERFTHALQLAFAPGTPIAINSGDLWIRRDVAPAPLEAIEQDNGRIAHPFSIPWAARSRNYVAP